ncbi:HprK-related kinase A [Candidatus Accumulibacter sp. ACC007]|uniref:HprK-related kinase A n=1 Tax=Candidatus Accumulibacter sp. ACC007 TaxID=2823333 RepID=UPI0025C48857|nr:HprK-related kinase A [Candidatus Accumulibacter sp. ACC007]
MTSQQPQEPQHPQPTRIRDLPLTLLEKRFSTASLALDYGAAIVRVRSRLGVFVRDFQQVYGAFAVADAPPFADFHTEVCGGQGLRSFLRPQSRFLIDGIQPFDPFPKAQALPHFEWGVNWCFAQRFNQHVLLHAGALALGDRAVIMAAPPGAGKSTLTAAMMLRGFRMLSDEFGVLCPRTGKLWPMLKPVALKNRAVDVIRDYADNAILGPLYKGTRKGDVAHLAPLAASVDARQRPARPCLLLFPSFRDGATLNIRRLPGEEAFARVAFNSFNYALLGQISFAAVAEVVAACPAFALEYSKLDEAIEAIRTMIAESTSDAVAA